mgnify:CR=1 FL=1
MKKSISLVVIADIQIAKIFEKNGDKKFDLHLISTLEAELDSNHEKRDTSFGSASSPRHGVEPHTDRRLVEKHKFAEKISHSLEELEKAKAYDALILVTPHKMLEEIQETLGNPLKQKITHKLAKNLVQMSFAEIKEYLEEHLV